MNRLQVDLIIRWYDKTKLLNLSLKKTTSCYNTNNKSIAHNQLL